MIKQASLGELAIELGINKSKLAYYFSLGLLKPIAKVGKMNVFDYEKTLKAVKLIGDEIKAGKMLKEIRLMK